MARDYGDGNPHRICLFCDQTFTPHTRAKGRQYACRNPDCQRARRAANMRDWRERQKAEDPNFYHNHYLDYVRPRRVALRSRVTTSDPEVSSDQKLCLTGYEPGPACMRVELMMLQRRGDLKPISDSNAPIGCCASCVTALRSVRRRLLRRLAQELHPDRGGDGHLMALVNQILDEEIGR